MIFFMSFGFRLVTQIYNQPAPNVKITLLIKKRLTDQDNLSPGGSWYFICFGAAARQTAALGIEAASFC